MKRAHVFLSLVLAVAWLGSGVGPAAQPQAADDSNAQEVAPGLRSIASVAVTPSERQRIQAQVAKLSGADSAAYDAFGCSVSVSGDTAIVGAWNAWVGANYGQGTAYIFYRNQGGPDAWSQVAKLIAADGKASANFGYSVSVSGDTAVVGARWATVGDNPEQGAAYVFYRDQGGPDAWGQLARLAAADGAVEDHFGSSVSVSGDTAIVGASDAWVGGNNDQGTAYVFYRDLGGVNAWGQAAKLTAADGAAYDFFGTSVSVIGDTAVVGVPGADVGSNENQGAAYILYRNLGGPDAWGQATKLSADDGAELDGFGFSVSVSGDTAFVGALWADVGGAADQGAAYVFYRDLGGTGAWGQVAKLTADDGALNDHFGFSASVSGDTAVVGAELSDVGGTADQGAVYVFYRDQSGPNASGAALRTEQQWGQVAKLTADDGAANDYFGSSVAISGDTPLGGAWQADIGGRPDQGAAYVFALPPVAVDDGYCTPDDAPLEVPAVLGVLANDLDPDGDPLTAVLDSGPSHGTLDLHADGSFAYTSTIGFSGVDTFTYHANDGELDSNIATVRITVPCCRIYLPVAWRNY
jgi:hypothetical protein